MQIKAYFTIKNIVGETNQYEKDVMFSNQSLSTVLHLSCIVISDETSSHHHLLSGFLCCQRVTKRTAEAPKKATSESPEGGFLIWQIGLSRTTVGKVLNRVPDDTSKYLSCSELSSEVDSGPGQDELDTNGPKKKPQKTCKKEKTKTLFISNVWFCVVPVAARAIVSLRAFFVTSVFVFFPLLCSAASVPHVKISWAQPPICSFRLWNYNKK